MGNVPQEAKMRGKNPFAWRFLVIIVAYLSVMLAVVAYMVRLLTAKRA